jgi:hypothetical protein
MVLQVGINHRKDRDLPRADINAVRAAVDDLGLELYFLEVAYSSVCLHPSLCSNIDTLNNVMKFLFGDRYIPSLHPREVRIGNWDPDQIHYTHTTAMEIVKRVVAVVEGTGQLGLSDRPRMAVVEGTGQPGLSDRPRMATVEGTGQSGPSDRPRDTRVRSPRLDQDAKDPSSDHGRLDYRYNPRNDYMDHQSRPVFRSRQQTRYFRDYRY